MTNRVFIRQLLQPVLLMLVLNNMAFAQAPPLISPAQYIIRVQSQFPAYGWQNESLLREYKFFDGANTQLHYMYGSGPGGFFKEYYVTEARKPVRMSALHKTTYSSTYCENYDPNACGGGGGGLIEARPGLVEPPPNCGTCWTYWYTYNFLDNQNIPLQYPSFDTLITVGLNTVNVSIRQASDNNYNLPSADIVSIQASGDVAGFNWEYQVVDGGNTWITVPAGFVYASGAEVRLNGELLFGGNWMSYINKTILFRMRKVINGNNITSNVLVYTHRLSSPKIVSITPYNNPCFGMDTAYVKVNFSRTLLPNEKINIFMKDTALGLDYSALNLDNTSINQSDYSYTWPRDLVQGGYRVSLIGKYYEYATYTGAPQHFGFVKLTDPELLRLYLGQEPALCFGGASGKLTIAAKGGVGNYKYEMTHFDSSFTNTYTNFVNPVFNPVYATWEVLKPQLVSQVYKVRLRDGNDCKVRDSLGREVFKYIEVKQPAEPLNMPLLTVSPITSYYQTNGAITVRVAGGTPFPWSPEAVNYKKYQFEWRDSATGNLITNFTLDTVGKFQTGIQNLAEGTYRFRAWDAHYDLARLTGREGCLIDIFIPLKKPQPLNVSVATDSIIRCYGDANGKLKAIASGGVPVSDSVKYNFLWYQYLPGVGYMNVGTNDSVLRNLTAGTYMVQITDKYSNVLQSSLYTLNQPAVLNGNSSTTPASCFFTANGSMSITPTGGTAPYTYEWSTGHMTPTVTNVAGGSYVVVIKDANLCQATKQVMVTSPAKINTVKTITPVGCNGSGSGAIALSASGGAGGYTYLWSNGNTTATASNLAAGTYWYRITDANGCYDTDTVTLDNPEAYTVSAGPDRKICTGQTIRLTAQVPIIATPLTAVWTGPMGTLNGTTISVNASGTYIVTVSNGLGCLKKDTVIVTPENATVNTSFTVSTQVFTNENTTLVNISPALQDSVHWLLPPNSGITLVSSSKHYCELKFADTGRYVVGIRAFYSNGCIDEKFKEVNVVRKENFGNVGNQAEAFIKQFGLYPNPTSGSFTLNILFNSPTVARVRIINMLTNTTISDRMLQGSASYTEAYNIGGQPAGTYVVLIETAKGNVVHKLNKL